MLDCNILDRARRLIESSFAERRRILPQKVLRIQRELQIKGMSHSSVEIKRVRATCEKEVRIKAKIIWDSLQKAYKAHGSPITKTLATDLKKEASCHVENAAREASELMDNRLRYMKPNPRLLELESIKHEVNESIGVEIDLYVDSLVCKSAETKQEEIVEVKPGMFGITVNIKEIIIRFWKWICSRRNDQCRR